MSPPPELPPPDDEPPDEEPPEELPPVFSGGRASVHAVPWLSAAVKQA